MAEKISSYRFGVGKYFHEKEVLSHLGEELYEGYPTKVQVEDFANLARKEERGVIVGIGGGKIMDLSKAVANQAGLPVLLIPRIAATCAAFSPLSVLYTEEGKYDRLSILNGKWMQYWWTRILCSGREFFGYANSVSGRYKLLFL